MPEPPNAARPPEIRVDRPADAGERRALLGALALAFRDNPMNRAIHGPDPAHRVRANRAGLAALVLDLKDACETRVVRYDGRIVGGLIGVPPGRFPPPGAGVYRQLVCLLRQGPKAMERWSFVTDALHREHPTAPHWYVAVLGVEPAFQGRGLGGRLLDALASLVVADPHPIYLESDRAESVAFYRARGYAIRGELRLLGLRCWRLEREAARRGGRVSSGEGRDLCNAWPAAPRSHEPPDATARRAARTEVAP